MIRVAAAAFVLAGGFTAALLAWTRVVEASLLALPFWATAAIYLVGVAGIVAGVAAVYGRWTGWRRWW